ncbi:MAG: 23S rRNA (guanosine2251-2'-O)-methyltransferase [Planctomycetota bacterium]|jgi:23S rRNA (guanosine2251-2'-O)-methyltransferase
MRKIHSPTPKGFLPVFGIHPVTTVAENFPKLVARILFQESSNQNRLSDLKALARGKRIVVHVIPEKQFAKYVDDSMVHQGVVALLKSFPYTEYDTWLENLDLSKNPAVLLLDEVQDPYNVGAIIRSAAALGINAVLISKNRAVGVTGTVIKASAGTAFLIPVIQVTNVNQAIRNLKDAKFWVTGLDMGGDPIKKAAFDTPTVFVVGGEGKGVRPQTKELCDFLYSIPMRGDIESLNASVSAAIACYEWSRGRN